MFRQLTAQVETLIRDNAEQRQILRELTSAVARLAVIEERQSTAREALDRAFDEVRDAKSQVAAMDVRVKALEIAQPENKATANAVSRVTWLIVSAVVGALLALVLVRQPSSAPATPAGALPNLIQK